MFRNKSKSYENFSYVLKKIIAVTDNIFNIQIRAIFFNILIFYIRKNSQL